MGRRQRSVDRSLHFYLPRVMKAKYLNVTLDVDLLKMKIQKDEFVCIHISAHAYVSYIFYTQESKAERSRGGVPLC